MAETSSIPLGEDILTSSKAVLRSTSLLSRIAGCNSVRAPAVRPAPMLMAHLSSLEAEDACCHLRQCDGDVLAAAGKWGVGSGRCLCSLNEARISATTVLPETMSFDIPSSTSNDPIETAPKDSGNNPRSLRWGSPERQFYLIRISASFCQFISCHIFA